MKRVMLWSLLVIGVGLIVVPVATGMFDKTSKGEAMVNSFRPIMQPANVQKTTYYYDKVFTPLGPFSKTMPGVASDAQKLVPALAQALHMTPAQVQQMLKTQFPSMAAMLQALPQAQQIFNQVPPGLAHYKPLVTTMNANVDNYAAVDSLPNMSLFPWFFIVPGILILLADLYLLVGDYRPNWVWPAIERKSATPTPAH
jgi:hypothetical protein